MHYYVNRWSHSTSVLANLLLISLLQSSPDHIRESAVIKWHDIKCFHTPVIRYDTIPLLSALWDMLYLVFHYLRNMLAHWSSGLESELRSRRNLLNVNGVLHTVFHYHPPIVLIWLKYCWKGRKIGIIHPSIHPSVISYLLHVHPVRNQTKGTWVNVFATCIFKDTANLSMIARIASFPVSGNKGPRL